MANEKRLIDANALKDRFNLRIKWLEKDKHDDYTTGIWDGCLYDAKLIDEIPTVDAVEVVHGNWLLERTPDGKPYCFHCSVCDDDFGYIGITTAYRYCPHCGAKMDGGNENGN